MVGETPPPVSPVTMVEAREWRTGHSATDALFDQVMTRLRDARLEVARGEGGLPSSIEYDDELTVMLSELLDDMDAYLARRPGDGVRSLADVVAYEDEHATLERRYFGHEFFLQALNTGGCASEAYLLARQRNQGWAIEQALGPVLVGFDVVVSPAYGPAWKSDLVNGDNAKYVSASIMAAAVAGWPILTLPMGLVEGLPVGLTFVGRPHSEWTLLEAARQVEAELQRYADVSTPTWREANRG
jgi:amidase